MISSTLYAKYWIDATRPDIVSDTSHAYWLAFHNLVKNSPIELRVNGAFSFIESILQDPVGRYSGGGMKYMFAFGSTEDRAQFLAEVDNIAPGWSKSMEQGEFADSEDK